MLHSELMGNNLLLFMFDRYPESLHSHSMTKEICLFCTYGLQSPGQFDYRRQRIIVSLTIIMKLFDYSTEYTFESTVLERVGK